MTPHWSDDPTDDLAWNAYSAGWDRAVEHHPRRVNPDDTYSLPYREGYRDGWDHVEWIRSEHFTTTERNTP